MKTLFIWLGICIIFLPMGELWGQCDPPYITTNPDAPENDENSSKKNTFFDWRSANFNLNYSPNGFLIQTTIPSPFNQTNNSEVDHLYLSNDFKPIDGWELIHRDLGYEDNGTPKTDLVNPYLILYNKFTGILRVFIAIGARENDYDACEFKLAFNTSNKKTALFAHSETIMEPVKTFSSDVVFSSVSRFLNEDKKWMVAEFRMAYDPCTCNNPSRLQLEALLTDSAKIVLSGSSLGKITAAKIDNKSGSVDQFKFKTAVSKVGTSVKSGQKTYKSIQGFISKFDTLYTTIGNIPLGLTAKPKMKEGLESIGLALTKSDFLKGGLLAIPHIGAAISAFSSFVSGAKSSPQQVAFGPLAIETQMKFDGFISSQKLYKEVIVNNPGSPQSASPGNRYPYYNEVMGVMNVLERPKIKSSTYTAINTNWNNQTGNFVVEFSNLVRFELSEDILYAINPATGYRQTEVDMLGAIFLVIPRADPHDQHGLIKVKDGLYRTPYLPLSCLNGYAAEIELYAPQSQWPSTPNSFTWYFQLMANLERTDLPDAQNLLFVSSYNVELLPTQVESYTASRPPVAYPNLLGENIQLENISLTGGSVLYATKSITIGPNVSISGSGEVTLIAGNEIIIEPGVELPINLDLQTGVYPLCQSLLDPATPSQISSACSSSSYQSRANSKEGLLEERKPSPMVNDLELKASPNPFIESTSIQYQLPSKGNATIVLYDMMGREVRRLLNNEEMDKGEHKLTLTAANLEAGIYHVVLSFGIFKKNVKIVKIN